MLKCPTCGSDQNFRAGYRKLVNGDKKQRFLCRKCEHRFSEKQYTNTLSNKKRGSVEPFPEDIWNENILLPEACKMKNLELHREGDLQFGDTRVELIQFALYLKKQGRTEDTAIGQSKILRILWKRGADLHNSESVKETIANQKTWCPGRKENCVNAYTNFLLMHNKKWQPPTYRRIQKIPFIPREKEIDDLIAGVGPKTAPYLQLLKETAIRAGEAWQLEWTDIDVETRVIRVKPEKGSNPRICRISEKAFAMLNSLRKEDNKVFGNYQLRGFRANYIKQRKRIALKLQNPRINQITFHTFRHWKATMEYHRTKDILFVMKLLGHKNIKNTLIYTQLITFKEDDQFSCKVATNTKEACELIENGFTFVTGEFSDGGKIFKKPK